MKWIQKKDKDGGRWILILNCPLKDKHSLTDDAGNVSGPSFADCANCEHQAGMNYEVFGSDGSYDGASVFPDRPQCSYPSENGRAEGVTH